MKLRRRAPPLILLGLIVALALFATLLLPLQKPAPPADLTLTLLDGTVTSLAELRGRPVLIAFWATSCAPCIEELPDLVRLYRDLHPRGFELIAVAMPYDPPLRVRQFVQRYAIPYPVALDVQGKAVRSFGHVEFIPMAFLLGPAGDVVMRHTGKLDVARARRTIERLLSTPARTSGRRRVPAMHC